MHVQNWAKAEALARREVRANGEEIEFGKWYSQVAEEEDTEALFAKDNELAEEVEALSA